MFLGFYKFIIHLMLVATIISNIFSAFLIITEGLIAN